MGFLMMHEDQNNGCDIQPTKELDHVNAKDDNTDALYSAWTKKCPSALSMFDRMMNAAKGKRIAIFLDYDGTLSPIVNDPDRAFMSEEMRSTLREVSRYFPTAIISGRCLDKVYEFVQLTDICYAGSHGMDIMAPLKSLNHSISKFYTGEVDRKGNEVMRFQPAREYLPIIEKVFKLLQEKTRRIRGAVVENNKFCLSVHLRQVAQENWSTIIDHVENVLKEYPYLRITRGRKVLEIRPYIKWNKGHAVEFLLETLGNANSPNVLPLYIGDDRTDEDAFKVLRRRDQGYPIIVSSVPKDTAASYSLRDPSEVMSFLLRLARWRRKSSCSRSSLM